MDVRAPAKVSSPQAWLVSWLTPSPGDHAHHGHSRRIEKLLQVHSGQPNISAPSDIKAPSPLREAALYATPQRILSFELGGLLPLPRGGGLVVDGAPAHGFHPRRGTAVILWEPNQPQGLKGWESAEGG
jgi:hypothetical protein